MKLLFILNGDFIKELDDNFLKQYNRIVCVDGGLNNFSKICTKIIPNYIIGDFDSVRTKILNKYKNKPIIVKKDNQDESDFLFALNYIFNSIKNISVIDICCATGDRIDHTLCNILTLKHITNKIKFRIIRSNSIIYLLTNGKINIEVGINKTVSLIPLTNIKNINTVGLKWELKNTNLNFGFVNGISNITVNKCISVDIENGECLIILNKD